MTQFVSKLTWQFPLDNHPQLRWTALDDFEAKTKSFKLHELWMLHLVHYNAEFSFDDKHHFNLKPGYIILTPPGVKITTKFHEGDTHYFVHFSYAENVANADRVSFPAVFDLGENYMEFDGMFKDLIKSNHESVRKTEVKLWNILYRLNDLTKKASEEKEHIHPVIQKAVYLIESSLNHKIVISELARKLEISQTHLIRLFKAQFSETVIGYIRQRRILRAEYLIKNTTKPIKEIAYESGIPDLHLFYRTIKKAFGCSPRQLREKSGQLRDKKF